MILFLDSKILPMLIFFYDSQIQDGLQNHSLRVIKDYVKLHSLKLELFDVKFAPAKSYQEYIRRFGNVSPPMVCQDDSVVMRSYPISIHEISAHFAISSKLPCLKDQVITYTA